MTASVNKNECTALVHYSAPVTTSEFIAAQASRAEELAQKALALIPYEEIPRPADFVTNEVQRSDWLVEEITAELNFATCFEGVELCGKETAKLCARMAADQFCNDSAHPIGQIISGYLEDFRLFMEYRTLAFEMRIFSAPDFYEEYCDTSSARELGFGLVTYPTSRVIS